MKESGIGGPIDPSPWLGRGVFGITVVDESKAIQSMPLQNLDLLLLSLECN